MKDKNAWEAMERGDFITAAEMFEDLIDSEPTPEQKQNLKSNYCYALVGLKRFDEARAIYKELFDTTQNHIYIHQLAMVEREAGEYSKALQLILKERSFIIDDNLALAANLYEKGLLEHLTHHSHAALKTAQECLCLSKLTEDPTMLGCAYRLLGNILENSNSMQSLEHYKQALEAFRKAQDTIACQEIEDLIKDTF